MSRALSELPAPHPRSSHVSRWSRAAARHRSGRLAPVKLWRGPPLRPASAIQASSGRSVPACRQSHAPRPGACRSITRLPAAATATLTSLSVPALARHPTQVRLGSQLRDGVYPAPRSGPGSLALAVRSGAPLLGALSGPGPARPLAAGRRRRAAPHRSRPVQRWRRRRARSAQHGHVRLADPRPPPRLARLTNELPTPRQTRPHRPRRAARPFRRPRSPPTRPRPIPGPRKPPPLPAGSRS